MNVLAAIDNRFIKTKNGNIYSTTVCDYNYWKRYLQVFDEVGVFGRLSEVDKELIDKPLANGPGVHFICPVNFIGPWQYLTKLHQLNNLAKKIIDEYDAFLLKVPGTMSSLLWKHIVKQKKPYGVEVIGDPWDSFAPGSIKSIVRPWVRRKTRQAMFKQCQLATAASYVTEYSLQKRYPPGCWSTHYSSIDLPVTAYINESELNAKIEKTKSKLLDKKPLYICHVGMMGHLYKSQDVLLDAVAICHEKGVKVEVSFVGNGKYMEQLQQQAKNLRIAESIHFVGKLTPGDAVNEVLDSVDLYVLPSRQEGLPKTIIEAMARGLPCIASNVGGIPELLDEKYMINPNDDKGLSEKIISVLKNEEELGKMARRNLQKAREYCWDVINKRRIEFYTKVYEASKNYLSKQQN